jgi:hypothetical protein
MSQHYHPNGSPPGAFLTDGCERCQEFVENLGRSFSPLSFRRFWAKMVKVEWDGVGVYRSKLDSELGRRLYLVALQLEAAFGVHPRELATFRERFERLVAAIPE